MTKSTTKARLGTKLTPGQGLKETACLMPINPRPLVDPYNTVPPLISGDKTKKYFQSGEQTEPQKPNHSVITGERG